jgi:L-seryl-tRNA(Ser) seleniumtransferase
LVALGRRRNLPIIDDIGSGALIDLSKYGVSGEPVAADSIKAGADLVLFSGDKLLGGPQCGLIVGRKALVQKIARHPLMRALRVDKLTLAALAATLRLYRDPETAERSLPLFAFLSTPVENLKNRAERLAPQLAACASVATAEPIPESAYLGGGAVPAQKLPTWCVALTPAKGSIDGLALTLRSCCPAIVGRVQQGKVLLDLRSVFPREDMQIVESLRAFEGKPAADSQPNPEPSAAE